MMHRFHPPYFSFLCNLTICMRWSAQFAKTIHTENVPKHTTINAPLRLRGGIKMANMQHITSVLQQPASLAIPSLSPSLPLLWLWRAHPLPPSLPFPSNGPRQLEMKKNFRYQTPIQRRVWPLINRLFDVVTPHLHGVEPGQRTRGRRPRCVSARGRSRAPLGENKPSHVPREPPSSIWCPTRQNWTEAAVRGGKKMELPLKTVWAVHFDSQPGAKNDSGGGSTGGTQPSDVVLRSDRRRHWLVFVSCLYACQTTLCSALPPGLRLNMKQQAYKRTPLHSSCMTGLVKQYIEEPSTLQYHTRNLDYICQCMPSVFQSVDSPYLECHPLISGWEEERRYEAV
jgi:hypothetical protein